MFSYMRRGGAFYRRVAALAVPIVAQNFITAALGMADTFMVGLLGQTPMAGVTLANVPIFALQLFFFGVQSGQSVLISQYWGKGDREAIGRILGLGWYAVSIASCLFAAVMLLAPRPFMALFGNDPAVIDAAARYGRIVGLSYVLNGFTLVYMGAWRSMGRPGVGMVMLSVSMGLNTLLNWVLIFGKLGAPALGVEGAALATLLSRCVEFLIMIFHAAFTRRFRLVAAHILRPGREMLRKMVRYAGPVMLNEALWGTGHGMYAVILGHMKESGAYLAAYTVTGNLDRLGEVVSFGMAGAAAVLVGQAIGRGEKADEVYGIGRALGFLTVCTSTVIGAGLAAVARLWMPGHLGGLFGLSDRAVEAAVMMLTVLGCTMPLRDYNNTCIVGILRGGGDVGAAAAVDVGPLWLVGLPGAFLTGILLGLDVSWVYAAKALEQVVKFTSGWLRVRSRKWIRDVTGDGRGEAAQ